MSPVSFQIISDNHLEAPKGYDIFTITPKAPYLALLGDIGVVLHKEELSSFLLSQLSHFKIVFFLPGNHEAYRADWESVATFIDDVSELARQKRHENPSLGLFVPLVRGRYDIDENTTVLGCTLFSNVPAAQMLEVGMRLNDFHVIRNWTVKEHNACHARDLAWLNEQVVLLENSGRKIAIFTHHSPTTDSRANDPQHAGSTISSGFRTDLSKEKCWTSESVKLWAFGHTHYNCDFADEHGKRVYTNQRGYAFAQAEGFDGKKTVTL
ncbi:hypothetical protein QBC42DRAFT_304716 [Cladorrhinum samala]|uniref:Calcineurin-like phosphoesterase domain-containing protein n=1 Tax=Cladorrhinum samala TaxID=585594 RepID=A0AAV9HVD8_9PEZI|nr:hypothetical protein QBC42DRAFT_304716 [Cladorrhinum samala]